MKQIFLPIIIGLVAGVISVLAVPVLIVGRLPFGDIALLGSIYIAAPVTILSVLMLAIPRLKLRLLPGIGFGVSIYLVALMLGVTQADGLKRSHCRDAKLFCETLIPRLEEYKLKHGAYPEKIVEVITSKDKMPMYLRRQAFYYANSNSFSLDWQDSPGIPYCSGIATYYHDSTNWDFCADWGGIK